MSVRKKLKVVPKEVKRSKLKISLPIRTRLQSVEKAQSDANALEREFMQAKSREEKVQIKRKVVLAANRAEKESKKRKYQNQPKKKKEYEKIAKIYYSAQQRMELEEIWQKIERPAIPS